MTELSKEDLFLVTITAMYDDHIEQTTHWVPATDEKSAKKLGRGLLRDLRKSQELEDRMNDDGTPYSSSGPSDTSVAVVQLRIPGYDIHLKRLY